MLSPAVVSPLVPGEVLMGFCLKILFSLLFRWSIREFKWGWVSVSSSLEYVITFPMNFFNIFYWTKVKKVTLRDQSSRLNAILLQHEITNECVFSSQLWFFTCILITVTQHLRNHLKEWYKLQKLVQRESFKKRELQSWRDKRREP